MCYHRSTGETVLQTRSRNTLTRQDLVVIVSSVFPLGNTTKLGCSHTAGSERRMCSMWIWWLADQITSLNFLCQYCVGVYIAPSGQPKTQALVASGSSMCSPVHRSLLPFLPPVPELFPPSNPKYLRHPPSHSDG